MLPDPNARFPCQLCNRPGRYVTRGEYACEQCKRDIDEFFAGADKDGHDAIQDARAERASETGERMSMREAVAASLAATHGIDTYYHLSTVARHPFGLPTGAPSSAGMTPDAAAASPSLRAAAADGSTDLPSAA